jgi:hypothetical protein
LTQRLHPAASADPVKIEKLIGELESSAFSDRQKATRALQELGEATAPALRRKLQGKATLDLATRLEKLLQAEELTASPERLRAARAVEVLEHIRSPEARKLLTILSRGAPEARLSREAQAALQRLTGRL